MRTPLKPDRDPDTAMNPRSTDTPSPPDDRPAAAGTTPGGLLPPEPAGTVPAADAAPAAAAGSGWRQVRRRLCRWPLATGALALSTAAVAQAADKSPNVGAAGPGPQVRLALVMGNQVYPPPHDLPPVHKNVRDLDAALKKRGFEVSSVLDVDAPRARQALGAFTRKVEAAPPDAVVFFYFVGHGLQLDAENLLLGAGVNPQARADVLASGSIVLGKDVVRQLPNRPGGLTMAVVDACRTSLRATVPADDGLNQVEAPPGCLIVFSTAAGRPAIAPSVETQNTFYTASLVKLLQSSDDEVSFSDLFRIVKADVQQTMQNHPLEPIRRVAQVPFIAENLHVTVPLAPRRIAANQPEKDAAPTSALFASASERDDYAQLSKSLWPAEIVRLADRFRQRFPNSRVAASVEVMRRGAAEAAQILSREDVLLTRRSFAERVQREADADYLEDLAKAARGDKDAAARIGQRFRTAATSGPELSRYEAWMQFAAELGNGIASYELALHYRRLDQPSPAARWEARSRELGYTPPPSLDNVRK